VLNAVLDSGINFIDTAVCYGTSEARIGRAISHRRGEFILATKCGCQPGKPMGHAEYPHRCKHPSRRRTQLADDAHRLHRYRSVSSEPHPQHVGAEGALEELLKLKKEGKLRFIGVSGILPNLIEQVDSGVFDVFQIPYSALQREHEHIIAKASDAGGGIIIRGGVARGAPTDWNKRYYMLTAMS